jgi:hypothetical protein
MGIMMMLLLLKMMITMMMMIKMAVGYLSSQFPASNSFLAIALYKK